MRHRCPWVNTLGLGGNAVRVCFRRGAPKWPEYERHVLAYFVETVDKGSGMIGVWDLDTGEQFEAPILTIEQRHAWTGPLNIDDTDDARRELEGKIGAKVATVKQLKRGG